jgi:transcriptional regulator with PAS, ATPase and Fis domain
MSGPVRASLGAETEGAMLEGLGASEPMCDLRAAMVEAAREGRHVVLRGEPGTGRRWAARLIHALSRPAPGTLIEANARALSADELPRLVRTAHGGSLLLRELGEAEPPLRVAAALATTQHGPGAPRMIATAGDGADGGAMLLTDEAVHLRIPPVRDRSKEDVAVVIDGLHRVLRADIGTAPSRLDEDVADRLLQHPWPGNVRQMRNALERALLAAGHAPTVTLEHLPDEIRGQVLPPATLAEVERAHIERTVRRYGGNRTRAARELGIARATLINKIRAYALDV